MGKAQKRNVHRRTR